MCNGCLVPFSDAENYKVEDYLQKLPKSSHTFEEQHDGERELLLRLTWHKSVPTPLLDPLGKAVSVEFGKKDAKKFE